MAHKTLINGTAYEVTGGKCLVNGTGYSIQKGRTLVSGTGYDIGFESEVELGSLDVGQSVYLNVNGAATEFLIVHQGNPDSSLYDGSCDGTWLLMKDVYERKYWHQYSFYKTPYSQSDIHLYLNNTFLGLLDSDVKEKIKRAKIPYSSYSSSDDDTVYNGSSGLSAKVFLLGAYEVGADTLNSPYLNADGAKLDFFLTGNTTEAAAKRIAYLDDVAVTWYTRSPFVNYDAITSSLIWIIGADGIFNNVSPVDNTGIRPALILPTTTLFDSDTLEYVG